VFKEAAARRRTGDGTLLFVDEIHRFNRTPARLGGFRHGLGRPHGAADPRIDFELNNRRF
jgi:hypothetical protein